MTWRTGWVAVGYFVLLAFGIPSSAYAYLDLGTGSYVIQVALASLVAGSFFLKTQWRRVSGSVRRFFGKKTEHDEGGEHAGKP